jgi:2-phosphoglycerate kinase
MEEAVAVKKLTTTLAASQFEAARAYLTKAKDDPNDTMSVNVMFGIHAHFTGVAAGVDQLISGINDVLERLERIETKLNARTP